MVNDAYIEHNKTKRQAWLLVPILFVIILLIALFGDRDNIKHSQPTVLESTPEGMLVELANSMGPFFEHATTTGTSVSR